MVASSVTSSPSERLSNHHNHPPQPNPSSSPEQKLTDSSSHTGPHHQQNKPNTPPLVMKDGLHLLSNVTTQTVSTAESALASVTKASETTAARFPDVVLAAPWHRVEVTIQRLEGVQIYQLTSSNGNNKDECAGEASIAIAQRISGAMVAFGGSSRRNNSIQVGSSSVCNQTGHLLVESEELLVPSTTISWRASAQQPHMSMYIPVVGEGSTSGTNSTSGAKMVELTAKSCGGGGGGGGGHGEKDEPQQQAAPIADTYSATDMTESSGWSLLSASHQRGSQPDNIVEILLRLQQSLPSKVAAASFWDGVAYVIIPPIPGRHLVAVPVQIPKTSTLLPRNIAVGSNSTTSKIKLSSPLHQATLHVWVHVTPSDDCPPHVISDEVTLDTTLCNFVAPPPPAPPVHLTRSEIIQEIGPLLDQIKASEQQALLNFQAQRRQMMVECVPSRPLPSSKEHQQHQSVLAYVWEYLFQGCGVGHSCAAIVSPSQHLDDPDDVMAGDNSTIATRPSLGI